MVARLIRAALTHRAVVFLLAGVVLAAGLAAVETAPLGVFPEFAPPIVEIQAESPGMAPEDVEALVTTPIEQALGGTATLDALRSSSVPGLAVVTAVFPYGTDPYRARQMVIERLALVTEQLPHGVRPQVAPLASGLSTILAIGLRAGATVSPMELRDLAQWTVRPRILAVPGVADVVVYGGQVRQVRVTTSPERLWAAGVTFDDLIAATTGADAAAGSGFVDRAGQRLLGWLDGRVRNTSDVALATLVVRDGVPVPVQAVADVADAPAVAVGDAVINGEPGLVLLVTAQPEVNVLEVTRAVEEVLASLAPALPADLRLDPALFRQASFVEHAMANLRRALIMAAVLVTMVLALFLGNFRAVAVSVVAIPLSLLAAVLVLRIFGMTLDVMVLGGLAIAIGAVVDDAIVDVENVSRRLRLAPATALSDDVVLDASVEVRSAVVSATFLVALVLIPVVLLGGLEGALFRPLALAYVLATLASLVVALTVTPALARTVLPGAAAAHPGPSRLVAVLRPRYERLLDRLMRRPAPVLIAMIVTGLTGAALIPFLRLEFLPEFHETNLVMHMTGAPGTGLDESTRVGRALGPVLLAIPGVRSVAQLTGRSNLSEDAWGAERSELLVQLDDEGDHAEIARLLRDRTRTVAGFTFDVKQYLNERIDELLEGSGGAVVVRVHGADLTALEQAARTLTDRMATVPGAVDVHAESLLRAPGIRVQPRRDALLASGMPATVIEQVLRAGFGGLPVGRVVRLEQQADLTLALADDVARDPQRLLRLPLVSRSGQVVPLGAVADVVAGEVRGEVTHEDGVRTLRLRLDVSGRALADVTADVERTVAATVLPSGTYAEVGGEYAAARAARQRLLGLGGLTLIGIVALLLLDFRSPRLVGLALVNVPLALVGGLAAVVFGAAGSLSLGAIVGFVTVFGLTMRNGIVLIAHFEHLRAGDGGPLERAGVVAGAGDRLAPILMTALVTGIALVPLLLMDGRAGGEIEHPLAMVVVAGLLTSSLLNLFVVPTLYAWTSPVAWQLPAVRTRRLLVVTGVTAAGLALLFWNLGGYPLWDPDEARHALIARGIAWGTGLRDWILPSLDGRAYHDKPILFYWLVRLAYQLAGPTELAARSVSALSALGTTLLVYRWGSVVWGRRAGAAAAIVLLTAGEFLALGRYASLDMLLTLWTTLALVSLQRWTACAPERGGLVVVAAATAGGMLTKGLVTPVLVGIVGIVFLATTGRLASLRRARFAVPLATFLVMVIPWYAVAGVLDPAYLRDFVVEHHLVRFFAPSPHLHPEPFYLAAVFLLGGFLPWTLLLPSVARSAARLGRDDDAAWFCVCWSLCVLVLFSVSRGKLGTYVLPALPPLALLTGRWLSVAWAAAPPGQERRLAYGGLAAGAAILLCAAPLTRVALPHLPVAMLVARSVPPAALCGLGVLLLVPVVPRRLELAGPAVALVGLLVAILFYGRIAPVVSAYVSDAAIARRIAADSAGDPPVVAFRVQVASLGFYRTAPVREIADPARLKHILARRPLVFVVTKQRHVPDLVKAGVFYLWQDGRHQLWASRPPAAVFTVSSGRGLPLPVQLSRVGLRLRRADTTEAYASTARWPQAMPSRSWAAPFTDAATATGSSSASPAA